MLRSLLRPRKKRLRMELKILLPYQVYVEKQNIKRIIAETEQGSFGILEHRRDCVAALVPGILTYEVDNEGETYVAIDRGVLVKEGTKVFISVRNAIAGADLGKLRATIEQQFTGLEAQETHVRTVLAKLESGFLHRFAGLHRD